MRRLIRPYMAINFTKHRTAFNVVAERPAVRPGQLQRWPSHRSVFEMFTLAD